MSDYLRTGLGPVPQFRPLDSSQVPNSAGGYGWPVDDWMRLDRFLVLGSEGGSYYAAEHDLTIENVDAIKRCLSADWLRTVERAVLFSVENRIPKNDTAIFVLALASKNLNDGMGLGSRSAVMSSAVQDVCRTGTHLLRYVDFVSRLRRFGAGMRKVISAWYLTKSADDLALQMLKYRDRYGWTHHDVMHMAHPAFTDRGHKALAKWAKDGRVRKNAPDILAGYAAANAAPFNVKSVVGLVLQYRLPREALPTEALTKPAVWDALLEHMPMTAMIRNLATMTRVGLIEPGSYATRLVVERLRDQDRLLRGRIHPVQVLSALLTYSAGHGMRGQHTWSPVTAVTDALDEAFYASFGSLHKVDTKVMLALDVSGSMEGGVVAGVPGLTPRLAAAAMAMVTLAQYTHVETIGFHTDVFELDLTQRRRLDDVVAAMRGLGARGTDCSLPIQYASGKRRTYDAFHIYTDGETWAGRIHPAQALRDYRGQFYGTPRAKMVQVAFVANRISLADPDDAGMLDVIGFDTSAPNVIAGFTEGVT